MALWIGLFRGINVGGNNKLPMKDLAALLTAEGLEGVRTYSPAAISCSGRTWVSKLWMRRSAMRSRASSASAHPCSW